MISSSVKQSCGTEVSKKKAVDGYNGFSNSIIPIVFQKQAQEVARIELFHQRKNNHLKSCCVYSEFRT
jgi:hypothetical protein